MREVKGDWHCLLLRSFQYWDSPKGHVETGETPLQGALREVTEETGIPETALDFFRGYDFVETGPYAQGKVARYYLARTTNDRVVMGVNPESGKTEHQEYRWVNFRAAQKLASPRVQQVLAWAEKELNEGNLPDGE